MQSRRRPDPPAVTRPAARASLERAVVAARRPPAPGTVRLVCFPFAGGTAAAFRPWSALPGIELIAVEYPGRGTRWGEPAADSLAALVERLASDLPGLWTGSFALWGHSFGAQVAWELATRLRELARPLPVHLFVSGARPPQLRPREPIHTLPDDRFLHALESFGGMPPEVIAHAELLELMLPVLRSDFRIYEQHPRRERPPLPVPISAWGGLADGEVPVGEVLAWSAHTTRSFRPRFLSGGHFFAWDAAERTAAHLRADLAGSVARAAAGPGLAERTRGPV